MKMQKTLEDAGIKKKNIDKKENFDSETFDYYCGYNERLAELNALSISIDKEKVKKKGIALVEEFFPKGECKERGKAVVLMASFLIYLANTENIIIIKKGENEN